MTLYVSCNIAQPGAEEMISMRTEVEFFKNGNGNSKSKIGVRGIPKIHGFGVTLR